ncbi:MAG: hypothetical protein GWN01_01300 [Nitrosopumilaceae archaeon]|nr:hypothetical protein [Nitrosopumilaceae archaeon]NIU85995.1 hypothetical protein [Nitrosopumilaceae archaeon]NIX60214.1 hypothetical protein [Nitrosopumilaceae archaeon]
MTTYSESHKKYYNVNKNTIKNKQNNYYQRKKWELFNKILDHYGRKCNCEKCNETNIKMLTLDHIYNDGHEHRKIIKGQTIGIYKDVVKNNFPSNFQILCHNCNWGKARYGICPHIR